MNVVINVENGFKPKDKDIIQFNASKGCWEVTSKFIFLNSVYEKIKDLQKENDGLNNRIAKLEKNIAILTKIVKGEIE